MVIRLFVIFSFSLQRYEKNYNARKNICFLYLTYRFFKKNLAVLYYFIIFASVMSVDN